MTDGGSAPAREDVSLPLLEPPEDAPGLRIGAVDPDLVIVATAAPRPFLLEGAVAAVAGTESRTPCEARFPTVPLVADVTREIGSVATVMVSPGRLRRERVGRGTSVIETVLVAPGLPLVVFDWSGGAGVVGPPIEGGRMDERGEAGESGPPIEILIRDGGSSGPPRPVRYRVGPRAITFALDRGAVDGDGSEPAGPAAPPDSVHAPAPPGRRPPATDLVLVVAVAGAEAAPRWTVEGTREGGVRCTTQSTDATTLVVVAGPPEAARTALRASSHAAVHERRAVASAGHAGVTLATGVAEVDDGFAWASTRLELGVRRNASDARRSGTPSAFFWPGLASVALGDDEAAAACAHALADAGEAEAAALLAGRLALATGRVQEALTSAAAALSALPGHAPFGDAASPAGRTALAGAAAAALADGLRYALPEASLERLRALGASSSPRSPARGVPAGRRLPTLGNPAEAGASREGAWLEALFAGRVQGPPTPASRADSASRADRTAPAADVPAHASDAFRAWATLGGDPDPGWVAWRGLISEGLGGGRHGAGAWDDARDRSPPVAAALLILGMLHGVLGILPDAPVGRLRLAPRLPAHLTRFGVRAIPIGDARVDLDYTGTPERHRFVIRPVRGRVPPLVVFEPTVAGVVREVLVDESPADVELTRTGSRTQLRLQTPLDAGRTIDVVRVP